MIVYFLVIVYALSAIVTNLGEFVNACMVYVDEFCKITKLKGLGSPDFYVFKLMDWHGNLDL
jgi:hypothetical protein